MPTDTSGLRRKLGRYGERLAAEGAAEVFRSIEPPYDTGTLDRSGQLIRVGRTTWRIWFSASYASFPDTGTRAHVIRPRGGGVLRFRVGNRIVYAKKVDHPGTEGTGWWSDKTGRREWVRALERAKRRVRV